MTKLAIIIVSYNSAEVLPGLLDSLSAGLAGIPETRIIVCDNDSRDDSVALARAHALAPEIIATGSNAGFAAAINVGLAQIPADCAVLILNPDIRLHPGAARTLLEATRQPGVGIAAPQMLEMDGTIAFSIRREPSLVTAWSEAVLGGRLAGRLSLGESVVTPSRYRQRSSISWATGAALCLSPAARAIAQRWREDYFLYSEEVEYQRRVRQLGLSVTYVPEAKVSHIGGDYRVRPRLYAILTANRIRDYASQHGLVATRMFQLAVLTGEALRSPFAPIHRAGFGAALRPFGPPAEYMAARRNIAADGRA